jgi:nanoRNase/pAp phosphatase (c-di-AMP/oligoRNAs hydrolase)
MTAFIESCVQTAAGKAAVADRHSRGRPRMRKLLRVLDGKKNILVTAHQYADPDAIGSAVAMQSLLRAKLKDANVVMSIKGQIGGGLNEAFTKYASLDMVPWDDSTLKDYDAIVLLDTQPAFAFNPLPSNIAPTAVIDHHSARGRKPKYPFCDIRTDVGATSSIVFSYFMELELTISPDLAAVLLYAIETDLAGAAGMPTTLDNMALSSLTLLADTNKLYQMRYVDLPRGIYAAYESGLANAMVFDGTKADGAIISHLESIDSLEQPAVIADFLLRYEQAQSAMVSAVHDGRMVLSLRTSSPRHSAGDIMRRLLRNIGEGGGHRTKAGGGILLENGSPTEIERIRKTLQRRLLRALKLPTSRGQRLVPVAVR